MEEVWTRIETWLAANAPLVAVSLNPPASEAAIAELEAYIGIQFPEELRAAYRRHDGQAPDEDGGEWGLFDGWAWNPIASVRFEWDVWKGLLDAGQFDGIEIADSMPVVRSDWWHPHWIPITSDGGGNHLSVDLAPGPAGTHSQLIETWHDMDERPVVATSFGDYLRRLADDLEAGKYEFDELDGLILRDEDE